MPNALEFKGVVKQYGRRRALDGLDLTVPTGSIFGLVGSNGAGKTTLMAVAMGLVRPNDGFVDLLGEGRFHPLRHAGRVSLLPQDSRLPLHGQVAELLRYYGRLQGIAEAELSGSVERMLDWVHLRDRRDSPIRTLSHGMARRVTIAQAFLGDPELILLDEPLSGLDPREVSHLRESIRQRRGHQTIIVSSHVLSEIEAICDAVAFIEAGRLVRQDKVEVITRRGHSVTYHLQPGAVPLAELERIQEKARWSLNAEGTLLTVQFESDTLTIPAFNAQVLAILLRTGIGIVEVRCGSDLESEYLASTRGKP